MIDDDGAIESRLDDNSSEAAEYRDGLQFVKENIEELTQMVVRLCAHWNHLDLQDDIICDVIYGQANQTFLKYDAAIAYDSGCNLSGFMFARLQLLCRKWYQSHSRKYYSRYKQFDFYSTHSAAEHSDYVSNLRDDTTQREQSALFDQEEVILLMNRLASQDAWLIRQHLQFNFTFEEIADKVGGAQSTLRVKYDAAMQRLKRIADEYLRANCD
jgi:DNA-directed RNA polymerase specialized sigma24 family protein